MTSSFDLKVELEPISDDFLQKNQDSNEFEFLITPLDIFQKKSGVSVTNLSSQLWCEKQFELELDHKIRHETEAMRLGTERHEQLEAEDHDVMLFEVETKEEMFALKILNTYILLEQLLEKGKARELWICGYIDGILFKGIIDELRIESSRFNGKPKIIISDTKTRQKPTLPSQAQKNSAIIQLQTYHVLLETLLSSGVSSFSRETLIAMNYDPCYKLESWPLNQLGETLEEAFINYGNKFTNLPPLSGLLEVVYEHNGKELGRNIVEYEAGGVTFTLDYLTAWWKGLRAAEGSLEGFKCRWCHLIDLCDWKAPGVTDEERQQLSAQRKKERQEKEQAKAVAKSNESVSLDNTAPKQEPVEGDATSLKSEEKKVKLRDVVVATPSISSPIFNSTFVSHAANRAKEKQALKEEDKRRIAAQKQDETQAAPVVTMNIESIIKFTHSSSTVDMNNEFLRIDSKNSYSNATIEQEFEIEIDFTDDEDIGKKNQSTMPKEPQYNSEQGMIVKRSHSEIEKQNETSQESIFIIDFDDVELPSSPQPSSSIGLQPKIAIREEKTVSDAPKRSKEEMDSALLATSQIPLQRLPDRRKSIHRLLPHRQSSTEFQNHIQSNPFRDSACAFDNPWAPVQSSSANTRKSTKNSAAATTTVAKLPIRSESARLASSPSFKNDVCVSPGRSYSENSALQSKMQSTFGSKEIQSLRSIQFELQNTAFPPRDLQSNPSICIMGQSSSSRIDPTLPQTERSESSAGSASIRSLLQSRLSNKSELAAHRIAAARQRLAVDEGSDTPLSSSQSHVEVHTP